MKCPKCHHENPDAQNFCGNCGQKLSSSSAPSHPTQSFDEKIAKIQRYLPKGLTEKILSQKDKIEGERKQVTVMFCDMEGFTPLVEKLGSEKAYSVMDEIYEILIHKVHEFEGTVNEMTGDGIMALFGAPIALEDAPQRALRSALSIHNAIAKFNGQRKGMDPIKMRIGVHTGPVVLGTLGNNLRVEFKAVGDTVNLASRMEGLAEPGTTYVAEDTFKLTEGLFRFETIGERTVKGKESAIPVYKLLSAKKDVHRPRLGLERSIYSEMVGREKELSRLELQVLKAENGEGSIVNIIGEAGIGKSRLVGELKNREVMKRVALFEGRAISTGRDLSFHPIIDLLKQWARIGEDDSGATALSKLETAIRWVVPEEMHEVLPFVATLMGMKLSGRYADRVKGIEGEALEKLILKNMRDLIIKATELKPHVIVMEDLHWADTSSIELNESLYRLAATHKIVFINVFRPGYKDTGERIIRTIIERYSDHYVEIDLQPLDDHMSETLINNMLQIKGLKHSVIDQIVERADGNPFFIEEVVRSFIDYGAVIPIDGAFQVTDKINKTIIPQTINDVLMARIDRLDEKTRDLVKIASVIGRSFFYRVLMDIVETIEEIDNRLSYLKEIQLILERRRMDEIVYLFKHALAQEAAYESILMQTRKRLHLKVAVSLETVFKERLHEFYGMLAYHFTKGENLDKAEEYMIKAGKTALNSSASSEALHYYQNVLEIYQKKYGKTADPEKLAMVEKNIAIAFYNKGEMADAVMYSDRVLARWGIKLQQNKFLMLIITMWDLLIVLLYLYIPFTKSHKVPTKKENEIFDLWLINGQALAVTDPMRSFAQVFWLIKKMIGFDLKKVKNWSANFLAGGSAFSMSGLSFRVSKKFITFAEGIIDKESSKELFAYEYFALIHNFHSGKWDEIRGYNDLLVNEHIKTGQLFLVSVYFTYYAFYKLCQGQFNEANGLIEELYEIGDSYDYEFARENHFGMEAALFLACRKLYDALKSIERFEVYAFASGSASFQIYCLGVKARIQILSDDLGAANKSLKQADEIIRKQAFIPNMFKSYYLISKLSFAIRSLQESTISNDKSTIAKHKKNAFKCGKNALKNSKKVATERPEVFRLMGLYFWLVGKKAKAVKWWKRGIEDAEKLGARPDLSRIYMEVGKRFLEEKSKYKELNGISAEGYLEKAKTMFQEMDLQWDLDELDKIVASF